MEKEKNNSGLIALVIILFLLVLGLGGYIVYDKVLSNKPVETDTTNNTNNDGGNNNTNKENDDLYICLNKYLDKNSLIHQTDLTECKRDTELEKNALTKKVMNWFAINIKDEYQNDDEEYYLFDNKQENDVLYVEDIYWKLELITDEKTFKDPEGKDYKLSISSDGKLHIIDTKNSSDTVLFSDEEIKSFAPNQSKSDGSLRPILLTKNGNVYVYSSNKSIYSYIDNNESVKFEKTNVSGIVSFVSTNVGSSSCLACHNIFAIDQNGEKHLIKNK